MKRKRSPYDDEDHSPPKRKKNGFRRSLKLKHLSNRDQRTTIFNKRLEGLMKKIIQLIELTHASILFFAENPDTYSLNIAKTNSMNIQSTFALIGNLLKAHNESNIDDNINNTELETILENIVNKFEEDSTNINKFLDILKQF